MPQASIIVPAFNAAATLQQTLATLAVQTHDDFEVVVVDDGSTDDTASIADDFKEACTLRLIQQGNTGLSGARNSGIAHATGEFVGFCDADDLWHPDKLCQHVRHLQANPELGLSYSGSKLIDEKGQDTGLSQSPRLHDISTAHVLKRNPVGNGSAPVMRRLALQDLAYRPLGESRCDWVFDQNFRQSEDIECWMRLLLTTKWRIEGVPGLLTRYRVHGAGLSAALDRQLAAWERMLDKLRPINPDFFARHEAAARAYQLRYLARRAISSLDGKTAWDLTRRGLAQSPRPQLEEPVKSAVTLIAALTLKTLGPAPIMHASRWIKRTASQQ